MDLITFGGVFLEIVFGHVPALPGPGEEVYASEFAMSCGGGALTAASAASELGARAGMAATLGDDLGSRLAVEVCRRGGVDISACQFVDGHAAGVTVVLNFASDRAFVTYLPPRGQAAQPADEHWAAVLRARRPRWCYLHAGRRRVGLLREARSLGAGVALDVALNEIADDRDAVVACARLADVFLPNETELLALTGASSLAAAIGAALGWCPRVVVKRGERGVIVADQGSTAEVTDGLRPVIVRDRTGAGDAFAGALIAALCQGASITRAAAAGNAAGSRTVRQLGAMGPLELADPAAAGLLVQAAAAGLTAARADDGSRR